MKIKFKGTPNTIRKVQGITWDRSNGHVADVADPVLCANLLTAPGDEFAVAGDEALAMLKLEWPEIVELAMFGIVSIEELAELNKAGITALAAFGGRSEKEIRSWVTRAKQTIGGVK